MEAPHVSSPQLLRSAPPGPVLESWPRRIRHLAALALDPIGAVRRRFAEYGDVYSVTSPGSGRLYVIRHPDHIRDVLVTHAAAYGKQHSAFRDLGRVLGDGLLTSEGETWRRQRRLIQPAFTRQRLAEYSEIMVDEALRTAGELRAGQSIKLSSEMARLTLRVVGRALLGEQLDHTSRVARAMLWLNDSFAPAVLPEWIATPARRRGRRAVHDLDEIVFGMIDRRRAQGADVAASNDLLQRLLEARDEEGARDGLSRREIRDQLLTLYLAGHETTSHALSWTFYLLSQHGEARAKLAQELQRVLGGRRPVVEDLPALEYTEWVVKEAMRLYPPVFGIPRRASEDTQLGPYAVPSGSEVMIWSYLTHRDPRFYSEPERFIPERFAASIADARPKHAYVPFGAGQRVCIGQMFAMIEAQLLVATLAQQVHFRYDAKRPPRMRLGVTLASKDGLPMRVERV